MTHNGGENVMMNLTPCSMIWPLSHHTC